MAPTPTIRAAPDYRPGVATVVRQLLTLGNQLRAVTLLGDKLQTVISRLESVKLLDPTVSPLLAELQRPLGLVPTEGSLIAKIMLLDRLLARLIGVDPMAAGHVAGALPALRKLFMDLLSAASHVRQSSKSPLLSSFQASVELRGPLFGSCDACVGASRIGGSEGSADTLDAGRSHVPASREDVHRRVARTYSPRHVSGSSMRTMSPLLPSPPAGGGVGSASGGLGAGAPAAVGLLTMLALCLLDAVLCRRFELDRMAWRATFLAARLERPG